MPPKHTILVVDDEADVGDLIVTVAEGLGLPALATTTANDLLQAVSEHTDLVFLDLVMPQLDGIQLLRHLSEGPHRPNIVLMSGIGKRIIETAHRLAESLGLTIVAELPKPFRVADVEAILAIKLQPQHAQPSAEKCSICITEEDASRALQHGEFLLHFQPQLRLADNHIIGVEGLVRWQHPEYGLLYPDDFIPALEQLGLIHDLGWVVATLGLAEYHNLTAWTGHPISLSINFSASSLRDLSIPDRLLALTQQYNVDPKYLTLEITESGLIKELSSALDVLTRLRMKRVNLSIDDFGMGYSMMQQLRLMPANELKIDKSFIQGMCSSDSDRVMVLKTIEIAHELELIAVAEGIETEEHLAFLKDNGCDTGQGYLFSKPLPVDALQAWLSHGFATLQ